MFWKRKKAVDKLTFLKILATEPTLPETKLPSAVQILYQTLLDYRNLREEFKDYKEDEVLLCFVLSMFLEPEAKEEIKEKLKPIL